MYRGRAVGSRPHRRQCPAARVVAGSDRIAQRPYSLFGDRFGREPRQGRRRCEVFLRRAFENFRVRTGRLRVDRGYGLDLSETCALQGRRRFVARQARLLLADRVRFAQGRRRIRQIQAYGAGQCPVGSVQDTVLDREYRVCAAACRVHRIPAGTAQAGAHGRCVRHLVDGSRHRSADLRIVLRAGGLPHTQLQRSRDERFGHQQARRQQIQRSYRPRNAAPDKESSGLGLVHVERGAHRR